MCFRQCTPVGEFAHCKCNVGYVGLPVSVVVIEIIYKLEDNYVKTILC